MIFSWLEFLLTRFFDTRSWFYGLSFKMPHCIHLLLHDTLTYLVSFVPKLIEINHLQKQPLVMFCLKSVFESFAKFTKKHLCRSISFDKVAGFRPTTLLKKRRRHMHFSVNLCEIFQNTSGWLTPHLRKPTKTNTAKNNARKIVTVLGKGFSQLPSRHSR